MRNLAVSEALRRRLTYENIARLSSAAAQINYEAEMTLDDVKKLHRLQSDFEKDPSNMQVAYEFFSELNRHGKYNTVIRLYDKYELAYSSTKDTYTERTRS